MLKKCHECNKTYIQKTNPSVEIKNSFLQAHVENCINRSCSFQSFFATTNNTFQSEYHGLLKFF